MISYYNTKIKIANAIPVKNVDIDLIFNALQKERAKAIIERLRKEPVKEEQRKLKESLPYFTPHGTFTKRSNINLLELSGFLLLDWDLKDNPNETSEQLIDKIQENPFIYGFFKSPSGGLKIFVKTDLKKYEKDIKNGLKTGTDTIFYPEIYKSFHSYFQKEFQTNFDLAQGKLSQPCFLSYDPHSYLAENPEIFDIDISLEYYKKITEKKEKQKQLELKNRPQKPKVNNSNLSQEENYLSNKSIEFYEACINKIKNDSYNGNLHNARVQSAFMAGGYVVENWFEKNTILNELISIARSKSETPEKAQKEVENSFLDGMKRPFKSKEVALKEREQWILNNTEKISKGTAQPPKENQISKENYSKVLKYINEINNSGRNFENEDFKFLINEYKITSENVKKLVKKVYTENADSFGIDNKPLIEKVELFLNKNYKLRYNVIKDVPEQLLKSIESKTIIVNKKFKKQTYTVEKYIPVDLDSIFRKMQKVGVKNFGFDKLKSLAKSDFLPKVDHFKEFFHNLGEYDSEKEPNYFSLFCDSIKLTVEKDAETNKLLVEKSKSDKVFFEMMLKKHLLRAIRTADTHEENRYCFTFAGEAQKVGKSRLIRHLNVFGSEYLMEKQPSEISNKDNEIATSQNFFYNFDEIDRLKENKLAAIKSLISMSSVNARAAYAHFAKNYERRCTYFATTNKLDFLIDDVNTRWLVFEINTIDWQTYTKIDINDIWRQLFFEYVSGHELELTKEEESKQFNLNENFEAQTSEIELVEKFIKKSKHNKEKTVADIIEFINIQTNKSFQMDRQKIGLAMKKLKFERGKKRSTYLCHFNSVDKNVENFNEGGKEEEIPF